VSWESSIREYTYKTNVDTSLTFWMLDARGEPSFGVTYVQDSLEAGNGVIGIDWNDRNVEWVPDGHRERLWSAGGEVDHFCVTMNMDNGTATVKRNDRDLVRRARLHPERYKNGFAGLIITDGFAASGQGGGFVAGIANIRISHAE
jgi:hypothetical protein